MNPLSLRRQIYLTTRQPSFTNYPQFVIPPNPLPLSDKSVIYPSLSASYDERHAFVPPTVVSHSAKKRHPETQSQSSGGFRKRAISGATIGAISGTENYLKARVAVTRADLVKLTLAMPVTSDVVARYDKVGGAMRERLEEVGKATEPEEVIVDGLGR